MEVMKKIFASRKSSGFTDALHGKINIVCGGCRGKALPAEGDAVENDRSFACHGPMEQPAARSVPKRPLTDTMPV